MSSKPQNSVVREDGLRYAQKANSTVIPVSQTGRMSCYLCGTFRLAAELKSRRFIGQNHKVCADGCRKN